MDVRPLRHKKADGTLWVRPPDVETEIRATLELATTELVAKAIKLRLETIVYWIRETGTDKKVRNKLSEILLARCQPNIRSHVGRLPNSDEAVDEVTTTMFTAILDLEKTGGDVYEAIFWKKLKTTSTDVARAHLTRNRRNPMPRELTEDFGEVANGEDDLGRSAPDSPLEAVLKAGDEQAYKEGKRLARIAIGLLKPEVQQAYLLREEGWAIESKESDEETISKALHRTPRTIRNWLREAEDAVRRRLGGGHD